MTVIKIGRGRHMPRCEGRIQTRSQLVRMSEWDSHIVADALSIATCIAKNSHPPWLTGAGAGTEAVPTAFGRQKKVVRQVSPKLIVQPLLLVRRIITYSSASEPRPPRMHCIVRNKILRTTTGNERWEWMLACHFASSSSSSSCDSILPSITYGMVSNKGSPESKVVLGLGSDLIHLPLSHHLSGFCR